MSGTELVILVAQKRKKGRTHAVLEATCLLSIHAYHLSRKLQVVITEITLDVNLKILYFSEVVAAATVTPPIDLSEGVTSMLKSFSPFRCCSC